MNEPLPVALGAILASLEGGCEVLDESWGVFVSNAEFHRVHMANFLWLRAPPPDGVAVALRRADEVYGPLRVPHRMVIVGGDGPVAPTVAPDLKGRGFSAVESYVMVARRPPELSVNPVATVRPARDQATRDDHDTVAGLIDEELGYDHEVSHQLLALQWRRAAALGREVYVVYLEGEPAGIGALDTLDGVGLIPEVATAPAWRNRGVAATLVSALRERAEAAGLATVCLETPARDTTWDMYGRLGFDIVGSCHEFLRDR